LQARPAHLRCTRPPGGDPVVVVAFLVGGRCRDDPGGSREPPRCPPCLSAQERADKSVERWRCTRAGTTCRWQVSCRPGVPSLARQLPQVCRGELCGQTGLVVGRAAILLRGRGSRRARRRGRPRTRDAQGDARGRLARRRARRPRVRGPTAPRPGDPSRNVAMAGRRGCRRATGAFHGRTRKTVLLVHTAASGAWLGIDVVPGVVVLAVFTPGPAGARSGIGRDRHVHRVAARGGSGGADDGRRAEPWVEVRAGPLLVGGGEAGPQRGHRRDLGG
jgi:hypothetical protein